MKKLLSLALAITMVFSFSSTAFATSDLTEISIKNQISNELIQESEMSDFTTVDSNETIESTKLTTISTDTLVSFETEGVNLETIVEIPSDTPKMFRAVGSLDNKAFLGWYGVAIYRYPAKYQVYSPNLSVSTNKMIYAQIYMPNTGGKWLQGTAFVRGSDGTSMQCAIGNWSGDSFVLSFGAKANVTYSLTYIMDFVGSAPYGEFYHSYYAE